MAIISGGKVIEGVYGPILNAGAPVAGTDEIQTITIGGTPTSGTFTLTYDGFTTAAITWSNVNATLVSNTDTALEALPNIGASGVTVAVGTMTAGIGTMTATFVAQNGKRAVSLMTATSALVGTSPTVAVAETTPGVTATAYGTPPGGMLIDTTNAKVYVNTGTAIAPTWIVAGLQS